MNYEKKITVTDKSSGKQRLTAPILQQRPRESNAYEDSKATTFVGPNELKALQLKPEGKAPFESAASSNCDSGAKTKSKTKQEITTLEQFISYAYARKGQPLTIKPKILQDISPHTKISLEGLAALQKLVIADNQFCVPRQILLAVREIDGYPTIKEALRNFVQAAMLLHPIFKNPMVAAAIRNLPEAPWPPAALKLVMAEVLEKEPLEERDSEMKDGGKVAKKTFDPDELRFNAANCLAVWLSISRNLSLEHVTEALNEAVWAPAGRIVESDITKLRALTEIDKAEGVGLACDLFKRRAAAHAEEAVLASSQFNGLRISLTQAQMQLEQAQIELNETKIALVTLQRITADDKAALHYSTETHAAHLRDDLEQLRSRVLRRLVTDVEMLGVGLSAIQTPEPRVHVIRDRVERVIDALQSEINKLREE